MLCQQSHINAESLAQICAALLKYGLFSVVLFLLVHPVHTYMWRLLQSAKMVKIHWDKWLKGHIVFFTEKKHIFAPFDETPRAIYPKLCM